jgi:SAM-dependent methyltransferase
MGELHCPACGASYPLQNGVPVLLPLHEQWPFAGDGDDQKTSLSRLQTIYDRAYSHKGLMGTELDKTYDRVTKSRLLSFGEPLQGKRLLDVGTGTGNLWDYVAASVESYALDLSVVGVQKAVERYPSLTATVSIAECIPYPGDFFDLVVASDTLEHTFSPEQSLSEIRRVLRSGGILGASLPIQDSLRKWGWNRLIRQRPQLGFLARLVWVVAARTLLFGHPNFQPIDRDLGLDTWVSMLEELRFKVDEVTTWPNPPEIPIVHLVRAEVLKP